MTLRHSAALYCAALALLMAVGPSAAEESGEFTRLSIEQLTPSVSLGDQDVEIVLRKIKLDAEVAAPPAPRRARYLTGVLSDMGANSVPSVSQGIDIKSPTGKTLNVYLEDAVAGRAAKELQAGDKAVFYGYYVYNSVKHGPGILVSGFEAHSLTGQWRERLAAWLHDR